MTRANIDLVFPSGKKCYFVQDSSAYPYDIAKVIKKLYLLEFEHDIWDYLIHECYWTPLERRTNSCYRYVINLKDGWYKGWEEDYNYTTNRFLKRNEITNKINQSM